MRLNTSNPTLFSLSCLFVLTSSLPLSPRDGSVPALVPRATYSVVPVDGGADATPVSGGDNTPQVVSTIIKTETSPPKTVVETSKVTLPPVTSTEIVQGPDRTKTITGAPSPTTVTTTGYSIINVSSPAVTIKVPAPVPSSSEPTSAAPTTTSIESSSTASSLTSSPVETTPAETSSEQSATPTPLPSSTSAETSSLSSSSFATHSTASVTRSSSESIPTTTATPQASSSSTSSTTSSGNGQWQTTYPAWSNSTRTSIPDSARTTSLSATILPTSTSTETVSTLVVRSEGGVKLNKRTEYMPKGQLSAHQAVQKRDRNSKRTPENKAQWSINKFFM